MKSRTCTAVVILVIAWLSPDLGPSADAQVALPKPDVGQEEGMAKRASGTFEVELKPRIETEGAQSATPGGMTIDKRFHGDLDGTARGEMLTAMTDVEGSAGYVAIEQVTGTLHGRSGTFVLQHSGLMTRGEPQLTITVVPDSGTGELAGLSGTMTIEIEGDTHSYAFEYTLPAAP